MVFLLNITWIRPVSSCNWAKAFFTIPRKRTSLPAIEVFSVFAYSSQKFGCLIFIWSFTKWIYLYTRRIFSCSTRTSFKLQRNLFTFSMSELQIHLWLEDNVSTTAYGINGIKEIFLVMGIQEPMLFLFKCLLETLNQGHFLFLVSMRGNCEKIMTSKTSKIFKINQNAFKSH